MTAVPSIYKEVHAQVHIYGKVGLISDGIFNLVQSSKNEPNHCPQLFNLE